MTAALEIDWFLSDVDWLHFATIPLFTGVVGWLINWTGLIMLFNPIRFHGVRIPGMRELATVLPRKLQEVPGLLQGGIGWQGIIPARAAKMGSIAVDKAIAKLGTPAEFYRQLEPEDIAEHIVAVFRPDVPDLVDEVMTRDRPRLWRDLPEPAKQAVYAFRLSNGGRVTLMAIKLVWNRVISDIRFLLAGSAMVVVNCAGGIASPATSTSPLRSLRTAIVGSCPNSKVSLSR